MQGLNKISLLVAVATGLRLSVAAPAWAIDCNNNGIEDVCDIYCSLQNGNCDVPGCGGSDDCQRNGIPDECEILVCPPIDVVFLIDTSESNEVDVPAICDALDDPDSEDDLIGLLEQAGVTFNIEILAIGAGGRYCRCCTGIVTNPPYGTTTPGLPEELGDCFGALEGELEDWAPATAIVAAKKTWQVGPRVIIPMSDEGPRCGDPVYELGDDRDAVENAIAIVWDNRVIVAPVIFPSESENQPAVLRLAHDLAAGGAPGGIVYTSVGVALAQTLADFVVSTCPEDCNGNGVIDSCEIVDGTSADCFGHVTDCCLERCAPGCYNPDDIQGQTTTAECACTLDSSCCAPEDWTEQCVEVAKTSCGLNCPSAYPNGVPDECEPSSDCNCNDTPDATDIATGTSQDCNGNCIPDECEPSSDCNANGTLDECDIADGTSSDCFGNVTDCCLERCAPGCYNPDDIQGQTTTAECVRDLDPDPPYLNDPQACYNVAWIAECVTAAQDYCSLSCPSKDPNSVPDECEPSPDCNCNDTPDVTDIATGTSQDCNGNCIPDECDFPPGTFEDCNDNTVPDECDIAYGTSWDGNEDGIPDECRACCTDQCNTAGTGCENLTLEQCDYLNGRWAARALCAVNNSTCVPGFCCHEDICSEVTCSFECAQSGGHAVSQCQGTSCETGVCCDGPICEAREPFQNCNTDAVFLGGYSGANRCTPDPCSAFGGGVRYVNHQAQGGDGWSWVRAYQTLGDALDEAGQAWSDVTEIWVAKGTYRPGDGIDRSASFELVAGVKVFGGFAAGETSRTRCQTNEPGIWACKEVGDPCGSSGNEGICVDARQFGVCSGGLDAGKSCWNDTDCPGGGCDYPNRTVLSGDLLDNDIQNLGDGLAFFSGAGVPCVSGCGGFDTNSDGDVDYADLGTAENSYHVVTADGTTLDGFVITGGNADNDLSIPGETPPDGAGGGIYISSGAPMFRNCSIHGCSAVFIGGGAYVEGGSAIFENCVFSNNKSDNRGGGAFLRSCSVAFVECSFRSNSADNLGGGVYIGPGVSADMVNCWVNGNSAGGGGGCYSIGTTTMVNSVFADNTADSGLGGGVLSTVGDLTMTNCTIVRNRSVGSAGGAYLQPYPLTTSTMTVKNCIFWGNNSNDDGAGGPGTFGEITVKHNCLQFDDFYSEQPGWANISDCDVQHEGYRMFGPEGLNAGDDNALPVDTHDLDGDFNTTEKVPFDLARDPRFAGTVDMGAFEGAAPGLIHHVNSGVVGGLADGTSWANAFNDFQDALAAAVPGDMIWVAEGVYRPHDCAPTCDRSISFQLKEGVTVYGGFPAEGGFADRNPSLFKTVLSGDLLTDDNVPFGGTGENSYHVVEADGVGATGLIAGFTITAGNANAVSGVDTRGGGILLTNSNLSVANCVVRKNAAFMRGGGLYNTGGDPTLANCAFNGNATFGDGGAVHNASGDPRLINGTLSQNHASGLGGGVFSSGGTPGLSNCIVWGNTDSSGGGQGAQLNVTSATVEHSCVQDDVQDGVSYPGAGNIDYDPQFVDADGPDDVAGTEDDNLRLAEGSPCLDAAYNLDLVPFGFLELDGKIRTVDKDGDGFVTVDMGAYEYTCPAALPPSSDPVLPTTGYGTNRYISFVPGNSGELTAMRITFAELPQAFDSYEGTQMWVGAPVAVSESSQATGTTPTPIFWVASLSCTPPTTQDYRDWSSFGTLHVYAPSIIPSLSTTDLAIYEVQAIHEDCDPGEEVEFSAPLRVTMSIWGDVVQACDSVSCSPPNGEVDFDDISATLGKFQNQPWAPKKSRADIVPPSGLPDLKVDMSDLTSVVDAFSGYSYPFTPLNPCP